MVPANHFWPSQGQLIDGKPDPYEKFEVAFTTDSKNSLTTTCVAVREDCVLPHAETRFDCAGRGEMPSGSLHRPMVSVGPVEQEAKARRRFTCVVRLFDNSVDCTRQPENEKASKNEMDEEFIRRVVRNP